MEKRTKVINLLGGSGLGKSTTAALLYGEMKNRGWSCELVREFVKEWAWEGRKPDSIGQSIIYGRQLEREALLYGKVDYVVTDSPLILCSVYRSFYYGSDIITPLVLKDLETLKEKGVEQINFLLDRRKPFRCDGRFEDEATARRVDDAVRLFLDYHRMPYVLLDCPDEKRVQRIVAYLELLEV
jgi:nicotinamide riboside kinase